LNQRCGAKKWQIIFIFLFSYILKSLIDIQRLAIQRHNDTLLSLMDKAPAWLLLFRPLAELGPSVPGRGIVGVASRKPANQDIRTLFPYVA